MPKQEITLNLDSYQIAFINDWIAMADDNLHYERSQWDETELYNYRTYGTFDYSEAKAKIEDILAQLKPLLEKASDSNRAERFQELRDSFKEKSSLFTEAMLRAEAQDEIFYYGLRAQRYGLASERADYYYLKLSGQSPDFPHPWALSTAALKERIAFLKSLGYDLDNLLLLTYYQYASSS